MKMHLGRGDGSRVTLCGRPAGFDVPGIPIDPISDATCKSCLAARESSEEPKRCTCPSGDGSLRWPCPSHPPTKPLGSRLVTEKDGYIERNEK